MRVILLNGPRGSGKDTIASQYYDMRIGLAPVAILPFATPMKLGALKEYRLNRDALRVLDRPQAKDTPTPLLGERTPRSVFIDYGTRMRAQHGQDYFAQLWLKEAATYFACDELIVPDCRFQEEVNVAITLVGRDRTMLVHVHRNYRSWKGDIGSHCQHPDGPYLFLNDYSKDTCGRTLNTLVRHWTGEKP